MKLVLLFCLFSIISSQQKHSELVRNLLANYSKLDVPGDPVIVKVSVQALVIEFEPKRSLLTTSAWFTLKWKDENLKWDAQSTGIKRIQIPNDRIWQPDLVTLNPLEKEISLIPTTSNAIIYNDGIVLYIPHKKFQTLCKSYYQYYPFDYHECQLKIMPWSYSGDEVKIQMLEEQTDVDMTEYSVTNNYHIISTNMTDHDVTYEGANSSETYTDVTVKFKIYKGPGFQAITIIFPCVILAFLSLLIYRLHANSNIKILLAVLLVVIYCAIIFTIKNEMPNLHDVPVLIIYMVIMVLLTSISAIIVTFTINIYETESTEKTIGPKTRNVFVDRLAKLFCIPAPSCFHSASQQLHLESQERDLSNKLGFSPRPETSPGTQTDALLKLLAVKSELEKQRSNNAKDWQTLATVIDRIMFWIYFIVIVIATAWLIIVLCCNLQK